MEILDVREYFEKYRVQIFLSIIFILWLVLFYIFFINNVLTIMYTNNNIKNLENTLQAKNKELLVLNKNFNINKNKYDDIIQNYHNNSNDEKSFANLTSLKEFMSYEINKNHLNLISIARPEILEDEEEKSKIYLNYNISGNIKNILKFIKNLENSQKQIIFTNTPMTINMKNPCEFSFYVATTLLNKKENMNIINNKFKEISSLDINKTKYVVVKFNNKKYVLTENKTIIIDNKEYKLLIKENQIYLDKIR